MFLQVTRVQCPYVLKLPVFRASHFFPRNQNFLSLEAISSHYKKRRRKKNV